MDILREKDPFKPGIRRAKTISHILLAVPSYSVGFFVLPGARMQVCIDNEQETDLLLEEIENDQNAQLPKELEFMLESRSSLGRNHILEEITQHLRDEMLVDKMYYNTELLKSRKHDNLKDENENPVVHEKITDKGRKLLLDRMKQKKYRDFEKRREEMKKFLHERTRINKNYNKIQGDIKKQTEVKGGGMLFETTERSYFKTLSNNNVPATSQRSGVLTDEEIDKLIFEASHQFIKNKRKRDINMQLLKLLEDSDSPFQMKHDEKKTATTSNVHIRHPRDISLTRSHLKNKLEDTKQRILERKNEILKNAHSKKDIIKAKLKLLKSHREGQRFKRDINMDLLKSKTENSKKKIQKDDTPKKAIKKLEKEATLRQPGQTSDELFEDAQFLDEDEEEVPDKKVEVFAELADPEYDGSYETLNNVKNGKTIFLGEKPFDRVNQKSSSGKNKKKPKSQDHLQFLTSSEEFTDVEDDLPCIHEFYGKLPSSIDKQWEKVVYELGEVSSGKKGKSQKNNKDSVSIHMFFILNLYTFQE